MGWVDPWGPMCGSGGNKQFYSVQGKEDAARLMGDGVPWPNKPTQAHLGEGVYAWDNLADAQKYMDLLSNKGREGLSILKINISESAYNKLNILDLTKMSDVKVDIWMDTYSQFGKGMPHGYDGVIRATGNFGNENFFSKAIFDLLEIK